MKRQESLTKSPPNLTPKGNSSGGDEEDFTFAFNPLNRRISRPSVHTVCGPRCDTVAKAVGYNSRRRITGNSGSHIP